MLPLLKGKFSRVKIKVSGLVHVGEKHSLCLLKVTSQACTNTCEHMLAYHKKGSEDGGGPRIAAYVQE